MRTVRQKNGSDSSDGYPAIEIVFTDEQSGMEVVRYANGTHSLRDLSCQQTMHSRVGPEEESRIVYAEAARVSTRLGKKDLTLWDVGMGTGANVTATLDELVRNFRGKGKLRIESFENAPRGLGMVLKRPEFFPSLLSWIPTLTLLLKERVTNFTLPCTGGEVEVTWRLHEGDFYSLMRDASTPDLIYFDFYAPKAHADLWSKERFRTLRERLGDETPVELFTYSAATPTRLAMLLGGFFVGYGPRTPMKAETSIASTRFETLENPLDESWRRKLDLSPSIQEDADRAAGHAHPQWAQLSRPAP